jgi:hypothetical protein
MSGPSITPSASGISPELLAEHFRIRDLTRQLGKARDLHELLTRLAHLRPLLVAHFGREEGPGGLFDTIRSMGLDHVGRLDRFAGEHQSLLADLDALVACAQACLAGPVAEILRDGQALASKVRRHEAAEDNLLLDTLYTDFGSGD